MVPLAVLHGSIRGAISDDRAVQMFALLAMTMLDDVNTINTWAEPHNANGVTPNTVIDSNDEPAGNNQQRMAARGY